MRCPAATVPATLATSASAEQRHARPQEDERRETAGQAVPQREQGDAQREPAKQRDGERQAGQPLHLHLADREAACLAPWSRHVNAPRTQGCEQSNAESGQPERPAEHATDEFDASRPHSSTNPLTQLPMRAISA